MHTLTLDNMSWWRQRYPHWVWLKTAEEDVSMINKYGAKRKAHAKANNFRATAKDDSDRWDIAGVAGEWAASRYLNIPIRNLFTTDVSAMKDGDICDWIEVKTRTEASAWKMDLADNERYIIGKEDRAYIACSACLYPEWVVILGWAWGHELKNGELRRDATKKHSIRIYPKDKLRTPSSLFDEVRKRHDPKLYNDLIAWKNGTYKFS